MPFDIKAFLLKTQWQAKHEWMAEHDKELDLFVKAATQFYIYVAKSMNISPLVAIVLIPVFTLSILEIVAKPGELYASMRIMADLLRDMTNDLEAEDEATKKTMK